MAQEKEQLLIEVLLDEGKVAEDLKKTSKSIADLRAEQSKLTKAYKDGEITAAEYAKGQAKVKDQLTWVQKEQNALISSTKLLTKETNVYDDTLNGQRQKLADMQKAFAALSAEQRNSEAGQAFVKQIKEQSDAVKELEKGIGDTSRNVGNYEGALSLFFPKLQQVTKGIEAAGNALMTVSGAKNPLAETGKAAEKTAANVGSVAQGAGAAISPIKGLAGGFKALIAAALKFITTPIGAIIAAIVVSVKLLKAGFHKLTEAISKNDDAGTALARLYAVTIQPIIDGVTKVFAKLADWVGKAANALADFFGGNREGAKAADELVVAVDNLQEAERQYTVNSAKNNAEIAKLRDQAVDKEKYTAEQRVAFLQQAIDLEKENLEEDKRIKAEQLRILEETAKREQDTSDATKDKIAQARAAMYQAENNYYTGTKRLNAQIVALNNEIKAEENKRAEDAKKAREQADKEREDRERAQAKTLQEIIKETEDLRVSLIEDDGERAIAARKLQGERELEELQKRLETDNTLNAEAIARLSNLILEKQTALDNELLKMQQDLEGKRLKEREDKARAIADKIKSWSQTEFDILEEQYQQDISNADLTAEQKLAIEQHYQEERKRLNDEAEAAMQEQNAQRLQNTVSEIDMWASQMSNAYSAVSNAFKAVEDKDLAQFEKNNRRKKADLDKRLDAGLISQEQYNAQTSQLDAELDQKKAELQDKQAKREKALNIFNATISTATAIIKALADPGGYPGIALSILAGITGAAQIAAIAAQPLPSQSFADGGVVKGVYDRRDNVPVNLSGGEMVINPQQQAQLFDLANGGMTSGIDYDLMAESMAAAVAAQPAPVMDYKEFTQFGKKVSTYKEIARV